RGDGEAHDLRAALSHLDRLTPDALRDLLERAHHPGQPDLPGLPAAAADRLRLAAGHGLDALIGAARARIPILHRLLLERGAVTHDESVTLARELDVATLADLQVLVGDRRFDRLPSRMQERLA